MEDNVQQKQTVIIQGSRIEGKVLGTSDVRVEGEMSGEVDIDAAIVVAKNGKTEADIKANIVIVEGEHSGNVFAKEFIQITPDGKVKAELHAPEISIEKGAKFSGKIDMFDSAE